MLLADIMIHDTYVLGLGPWPVLALATVLGAVLGSFMNVVVYRLPRRMSLIHPGSHCPACGHPIRWCDNVPILGWLRLGGRCRDCRAPISARYPLVEGAAAVTSALVCWSALVELPPLAGDVGGVVEFEFGTYAIQSLLMCTLISAALIEYDGHLAPGWMLSVVLVIGFAAGSLCPDMRRGGLIEESQIRGVREGAAGLLAALVLGALAWPAWVKTAHRADIVRAATAVAELALVGVVLGVGELAVITTISMGCYAVLSAASRFWPSLGRLGWGAALAIATLASIVSWPIVEIRLPNVARHEPTTLLLAAGLIVATLALLLRLAAFSESRLGGSHEE